MTGVERTSRLRMISAALLVLAFGATVTRAADPSAVAPPLEQATDVKAQPLLLLAKFPNAGPGLAGYVAQALAKRPGIFDAILSILPDTSREQASAIGAGVVRALRSLAAKEPALVKEMVAKIERSSNIAFKTTFFAIGPHDIAPRPRYALITPPPYSLEGVGFGDELLPNRGRLGGESQSETSAQAPAARGDQDYFAHGTIVALISSNAAKNGTVPTSPSH